MKQYIYKPSEAGLAEWPSGTLRLEGMDVTENPDEADVFVIPGSIRIFEKRSGVLDLDKLHRLPYFYGRESRHAFFDVSDNFTRSLNLPIIFIRCDARSWMLPHDPNTIQMAWPVEDYAECVELPDDGLKYDVTFRGWLSSDARTISSNACKDSQSLKCDIDQYSDFTGYLGYNPDGKKSEAQVELELKELARRRAEFRRSMKESRICLCPESIPGVLPYRFFEAMSAGRVPLLVGSNYVLPFADEIDYDEFILSTAHPENAADIAVSFVHSYRDESIIRMGQLARDAWVKWLDSRKWPQLHAYAVQKHAAVAA